MAVGRLGTKPSQRLHTQRHHSSRKGGAQGSASKDQSPGWTSGTLHLKMEAGRAAHEKQPVTRVFLFKKSHLRLSLWREETGRLPHRRLREGVCISQLRPLAGEAGAICSGHPLRGEGPPELLLSFSVVWPLFALPID